MIEQSIGARELGVLRFNYSIFSIIMALTGQALASC